MDKDKSIPALYPEPDLLFKNATYINLFTHSYREGDIAVHGDKITSIGKKITKAPKQEIDLQGKFLLPGFIDSHIHLESSLVMPDSFARAVIPHGTTTVVTDPHEIANVLGTNGLDLMLSATEDLPIDVNFMLPSCVPATSHDESGATLTADDLLPYLSHHRVLGLAEVMDFTSVLSKNPELMKKIRQTQDFNKIIDGHAPMLSGDSLQRYVAAGITSDHECISLDEAKEKLSLGQYIMIREGTAAHNLQALAPLLTEKTFARCLFCTDDKHPNHLLEQGHIDMILRSAVALKVDPIIAVQVATLNAAQYFGMRNKGAIAPGYCADLVVVDDLIDFNVSAVFKNGVQQYDNGILTPRPPSMVRPDLLEKAKHTINCNQTTGLDFNTSGPCAVLGLIPGELLTTQEGCSEKIDLSKDILKIAVLERHKNTGNRGIGFLNGYGLKSGAIATTISHDSHNIIVVGTSEEEMSFAVNELIKQQGGILVTETKTVTASLPLPVGGIMSLDPLTTVNTALEYAKKVAYGQGVSKRIDPFMILSFLSLSVIPTLRITTHGMFNVSEQTYL